MHVQNSTALSQYNDFDRGGNVNITNFAASSPFPPTATELWLSEFYAYDFEREKCPMLTTGYDSFNGKTEIEFIYQTENNIIGDVIFMFFVMFDTTMGIGSQGSVRVYK
jgi:hypothetical protein